MAFAPKKRKAQIGDFRYIIIGDGNSALMLVTARLRYVAGREWGQKRYMNMRLLIGCEVGIEVTDA